MRVYIAGKYSAWPRLEQRREEMRQLGYSVSSTWIDTGRSVVVRSGNNSLALDDGLNRVAAERDIHEVLEAEMLVLDTFDESYTGGREVELGFALDRELVTVLIGPKRNVFHYLVNYSFNNWEEALEWLRLQVVR